MKVARFVLKCVALGLSVATAVCLVIAYWDKLMDFFYNLADKVEEFIKEHNFKIKLNYGAFPDRPYDSPAVWGSREKIDIILKNCGEL